MAKGNLAKQMLKNKNDLFVERIDTTTEEINPKYLLRFQGDVGKLNVQIVNGQVTYAGLEMVVAGFSSSRKDENILKLARYIVDTCQ